MDDDARGGKPNGVPSVSSQGATQDLSEGRRDGWLSVLVGRGSGSTHKLEDDCLIGRESHCQIWLPDEDVSREHARIKRVAGQFQIIDLESKNGVRVNGKTVKKELLDSGDIVTLGSSTVLMFSRLDPNEGGGLHQLQRLESIGRLAGGLAHDYNNLLTVMINNTAFLAKRYPDLPREVQDCIQEIRQAAEQAAAISSRLLGFARCGEWALESQPMEPLVAQAVALARNSFSPAVEWETTVTPDLAVLGDSNQLCQVLMNLLINAAEATEQGTVRVTAEPITITTGWTAKLPVAPGRYAQISVADTGTGMDERTRERIFEPFFTTKKEVGTGLGLSTALNIIRAHNGCINVESAPGEGTTFWVLVPAAGRSGGRALRSRPPTGESVKDGGGILVVDDDHLVLRSTGRALRTLGYEVILANGGREAIEKLMAHPQVCLVLLDVMMPEMDGRQTYEALRQTHPDLKVLLFSGHADTGEIRDLLSAGALGLIHKPVRLTDLKQAVQSALASPRSL